jgi:hypothetical protein
MEDGDILNDLSHLTFSETDNDRLVMLAQGIGPIFATVYGISPDNEILLMERLVEPYESEIDIEEPSYMFMIERFSLFAGDIKASENWMYDHGNNLKIVDYGCDDDIAENHTDWEDSGEFDCDEDY